MLKHGYDTFTENLADANDAAFGQRFYASEKPRSQAAALRVKRRLYNRVKRADDRLQAAVAAGAQQVELQPLQLALGRQRAALGEYLSSKSAQHVKTVAGRIGKHLFTMQSRVSWRYIKKAYRKKSGATAENLTRVLVETDGGKHLSVSKEEAQAAGEAHMRRTFSETAPVHAMMEGNFVTCIERVAEGLPDAPELQPFAEKGVAKRHDQQWPQESRKIADWGTIDGEVGDGRRSFVEEAARKLARGSAPGPDGMKAEYLLDVDSHYVAVKKRQVPEGSATHDFEEEGHVMNWSSLSTLVAAMFMAFWMACWVPSSWRRTRTVLVAKGEKGDPNLRGYRAITSGCTMEKLFCHCLLYGLEGWATRYGRLCTEQRGFRSHCSTEDAVLNVLAHLETRGDLETHLLFVDFAAAYDTVDHQALLAKLRAIGTGEKFVRMVEVLITGRTTSAVIAGKRTGPIEVKRGLPQGHVLSPILFALFLDDLLRELKREAAKEGGDWQEWCVLAYADDLLLRAASAEKLQKLAKVLERWASAWGMRVNLGANKTEHLVVNEVERVERAVVRYGDCIVRRVQKYKYLGVLLNGSGCNRTAQQNKCMGAAIGATKVVDELQTAYKSLTVAVTARLWQALVLPQLLYSIGCWGSLKISWKNAEKLLQNGAKRVLLGSNQGRGASVGAAMAEVGWQSMEHWCAFHRLRLLSAMLRAPEGDLERRTLNLLISSGKRKFGWLWELLIWCKRQKCAELTTAVVPLLRELLEAPGNLLGNDPETSATLAKRLEKFELKWGNGLFARSLATWNDTMSGEQEGSMKAMYRKHCSERRDRGRKLSDEPLHRWGANRKPSPILASLRRKKHRRLLAHARLGVDPRSLCSKAREDVHLDLDRSCPCCGREPDTPAHMVGCEEVHSHVAYEEGWDACEKLFEHECESVREIVHWVRSECGGETRVKLLLGQSRAGLLPAEFRGTWLHKVMRVPRVREAWARGVVRVLQGAWAAHDAAMAQQGLSLTGALHPEPAQEPPVAPEAVQQAVPEQEEEAGAAGLAEVGGAEPPPQPVQEGPVLAGLGELAGQYPAGHPEWAPQQGAGARQLAEQRERRARLTRCTGIGEVLILPVEERQVRGTGGGEAGSAGGGGESAALSSAAPHAALGLPAPPQGVQEHLAAIGALQLSDTSVVPLILGGAMGGGGAQAVGVGAAEVASAPTPGFWRTEACGSEEEDEEGYSPQTLTMPRQVQQQRGWRARGGHGGGAGVDRETPVKPQHSRVCHGAATAGVREPRQNKMLRGLMDLAGGDYGGSAQMSGAPAGGQAGAD
jgi:hypothetical protein